VAVLAGGVNLKFRLWAEFAPQWAHATMIAEVYDALVEAGAGRYPPRWAAAGRRVGA
jgi:hypothetical protein